MTRYLRAQRSIILLTMLVSFFIHTAAIADDVEEIEIVKVRDNLHMLVSPMGGNVTVSSGEDGIFIIDDNLTGRSADIEKAIRTIRDEDVKFILNTHYHFDHTGANEHFGKQDAIIVAHNNVRERLSTKQFITYFKKEMNPLSKEGLPVVTFSNDITFHFNDDDVRIIHLPAAHTDGDAAAFFKKQNVIVAGDIIFYNMYPFVDTEHGGSIMGVIAALNTLIDLADNETRIVPGHGAVINRQQLVEYRDMLLTITNRVSVFIENEKTLEATIASKPTNGFDDVVEPGIVDAVSFITTIYEDLSR